MLEGRLRFVENQVSAGAGSTAVVPPNQPHYHHHQQQQQQQQQQFQAPPRGPAGLLDALLAAPQISKPAPASSPAPHPPPLLAHGSPWASSSIAHSPARQQAAARRQWQSPGCAGLDGALPPRPADAPHPHSQQGGQQQGLRPFAAQSTQELVDKLAARHAEAQALLQRMQEQRARRLFG